MTPIEIRGARPHNLKGIDVRLDHRSTRRLRADEARRRARGSRCGGRLRTGPRRRHDAGRPDARDATSWTSRPWGSIRGTSITSSPCSTACGTTATRCSSSSTTPAVIRAADWIVDIGPRAGDGGGEVVFSGRLDDLLRGDTATSRALKDQAAAPSPGRRAFDDAFRIENATANNLRNLSVRIPKGALTCVTGVAGSGKSSLVAELIDTLRRRPAGNGRGGEVVVVDQRPVGRSSRSNPATYVGVFDAIRRAFAAANRVSARTLQLQRQGCLPEMQGPGLPGGGAVVPRRRAPGLQGLRRQAVPG